MMHRIKLHFYEQISVSIQSIINKQPAINYYQKTYQAKKEKEKHIYSPLACAQPINISIFANKHFLVMFQLT